MPVMRPFAVLATFAVWTALVLPISGTAGQLTPAQWREDLQTLDDAVRTVHKFPFHTVSETDYSHMVQRLHDDIPQLNDQQIIVALASIVAAVNDGHTRLTGWHRNQQWGFESYPVALYWFEDGLFVRQAHPQHADLVGAQVMQIGELSAAEAQQRIEQVVAADNAHGERFGGPAYLISPQVMQALGILARSDEAMAQPYLLRKDGRTWRPTLAPLAGEWPGWTRGFVSDPGWADANDEATRPVPAWRRHVDKTFWFEVLPEDKLLYVQQNQVRDGYAETLQSFYARVWQAFESNDIETLVLDLRLNGGGNNYLNKPALTTMVRADAHARTFTIIGRQTFSACQNLVNELSRWTNTVFVGEPTAERVNFYGDTRSTELPNSGLTVRASWLWWQNMDPRDTSDALYPELAVALTSTDYANNIDPVLDAIRAAKDILTEEKVLALLEEGAREVALDGLRQAAHDPLFRHANIEAMINRLGYQRMGGGHTEDAVALFELNVEQYPDSWNVYDSLGEMYETLGRKDRALQLFEKSLSLNPDSPTGLAAVERLRNGGAKTHVDRH